jgi:SAM-dependent methyltransferase
MSSTSLLVRLFGFHAMLIHADSTVVDRWLWLKRRLPKATSEESLLDVGCGSGAFTIGAAKRGYRALGLSWDKRNQTVATQRAAICGATNASFNIEDARKLDSRKDLLGKFDIVVSLECIEHILDDRKLMIDLANCLKPGGRLLLTTPYGNYKPITKGDNGPWSTIEDGGHVRRGYTEMELKGLCQQAGLTSENISFCTGVLSQKITFLWRVLSQFHPMLAWLLILPLRPLPILVDSWITPTINWPFYSICLEAKKEFRP